MILDRTNTAFPNHANVNWWKHTSTVIDWFKNIPDKKSCYFMVLDIENFYPSISENLFKKAIQYAKNIVEILDHDMVIINHSQKFFIFYENKPWVKKEGNEDFDATTGSNDGARISELIGLLMFSKLVHLFQDNSVGLYWDDGLGVLRNFPGPETKRLAKDVLKIFKDCGLSITSKTNLKIIEFLDVTFDLQNNSYKPYSKPDNLPVYIHKHSNQQLTIRNDLPKTMAKIMSDLSSRENIFCDAIPKEALRKKGFTFDLVYTPKQTGYCNNNEENKRQRQKIIWFNSQFSKIVKDNIGKRFPNLIKRHFPKQISYIKSLAKNTVKVSYRCMINMASVLSSQNLNVINPLKHKHMAATARQMNPVHNEANV